MATKTDARATRARTSSTRGSSAAAERRIHDPKAGRSTRPPAPNRLTENVISDARQQRASRPPTGADIPASPIAPTPWRKLTADPEAALTTVCELIESGRTITEIAKSVGITQPALSQWLEANPYRSARARDARAKSARLWDEKAETVIAEASDNFQLAKAKELAIHYRWRAKAMAPKEYGDKVQVDADVSVRDLPDHVVAERAAKLAALLPGLTANVISEGEDGGG